MDEVDDCREHLVLQQKADFDEAASRGQVDTPFLLRVILVIDLHIADALEQERDQEVLVLGDQVQDLTLLVKASELDLSDRCPEFDALGADLRLILLGDVRRDLAQTCDIGAHLLVLLLADLDQALHGGLADADIARLHGLIKDLAHDKVALLLDLEVVRGVGDGVQQRLDSQFAGFKVGLVLADVVRKGEHDLILQLCC